MNAVDEKPIDVMQRLQAIQVRQLGQQAYAETFDNMRAFVLDREAGGAEAIWLVQHSPVYTQGMACKAVTLAPSSIPVVKSDRGGQITYHGPGQLVMYAMLELKAYGLGVKSFVDLLEQTSINTLAGLGINGQRRAGAPGVYVDEKKIAALGLRFKRGCSYHGLSLNVNMDLRPFANIDPCGYQGLEVTQIADLIADVQYQKVEQLLLQNFLTLLEQHVVNHVGVGR